MKKNKDDENIKSFSDYQNKSWFIDENKNIKTGISIQEIMSGNCETVQVKEFLHSNPYPTFRIVINPENQIFLFKTSRELK